MSGLLVVDIVFDGYFCRWRWILSICRILFLDAPWISWRITGADPIPNKFRLTREARLSRTFFYLLSADVEVVLLVEWMCTSSLSESKTKNARTARKMYQMIAKSVEIITSNRTCIYKSAFLQLRRNRAGLENPWELQVIQKSLEAVCNLPITLHVHTLSVKK